MFSLPLASCIRNSTRSTSGRLPRTRCAMQEHNLDDGNMCILVYRASNGRAQPLRHAFWEYVRYAYVASVCTRWYRYRYILRREYAIRRKEWSRYTDDFTVAEINDFRNIELTEANWKNWRKWVFFDNVMFNLKKQIFLKKIVIKTVIIK